MNGIKDGKWPGESGCSNANQVMAGRMLLSQGMGKPPAWPRAEEERFIRSKTRFNTTGRVEQADVQFGVISEGGPWCLRLCSLSRE